MTGDVAPRGLKCCHGLFTTSHGEYIKRSGFGNNHNVLPETPAALEISHRSLLQNPSANQTNQYVAGRKLSSPITYQLQANLISLHGAVAALQMEKGNQPTRNTHNKILSTELCIKGGKDACSVSSVDKRGHYQNTCLRGLLWLVDSLGQTRSVVVKHGAKDWVRATGGLSATCGSPNIWEGSGGRIGRGHQLGSQKPSSGNVDSWADEVKSATPGSTLLTDWKAPRNDHSVSVPKRVLVRF